MANAISQVDAVLTGNIIYQHHALGGMDFGRPEGFQKSPIYVPLLLTTE
jgi:hypothetical protein